MSINVASSKNNINLGLGDIIRIVSPNNDKYNDKTYYIEYIDQKEIKIVNKQGLEILYLGETGELTDHSIKEIHILSRNVDNSYTKINELNVNTWLDIKFSGDIPFIITGLITNVIEDMIEIKTIPNNDIIFIDFAYRGIPPELNIEYIQIREEPKLAKETVSSVDEAKDDSDTDDTEQKESSKQIEEGIEKGVEGDNEGNEGNEEELNAPKNIGIDTSLSDEIPSEFPEFDIDENDIENIDMEDPGELLGAVDQFVNVAKSRRRYTLEEQKEDILSKLSDMKPLKYDKHTINKFINRFEQLRELFTIFDKNDNPTKALRLGSNFNTIKEKLYNHDNRYFTFIPVTSLRKNLYDLNIEDANSNSLEFDKILANDLQAQNDYENKISSYLDYMNIVNESTIPYIRSDYKESLYSMKLKNDMVSIVDNDGLYNLFTLSTEFDKSIVNETKYFTQRHVSQIKFNDKIIMIGENLDIKSLITLPFEYAKYSSINLYKSNMLEKVNLSKKFIGLNTLLVEDLKLNSNLVTKKGDKLQGKANNNKVFTRVTEHILDSEIAKTPSTYREMFDTVLPDSNNILKYVNSRFKFLSLYDVLKSVEAYNIYSTNIHFYQYKQILDALYKNINEFWTAFKRERKRYNFARSKLQKLHKNYPSFISLMDMSADFEENYSISDANFVSDSELLNYINNHDSGVLICEQVKLKVINMINNVKIDYDAFLNNTEDVKEKEIDECSSYKISKKYDTLEALNADNDKDIFYDKYYDDTVYDILNVYKKEQNEMNDIEFIDFLRSKLIDVNGIKEEDTKEIAETMVRGQKLVQEGNYAILQKFDENYDFSNVEYYKRVDKKWVFDEEATKSKIKNAISINNKICEKVDCHEKTITSKPLTENFKDANKDYKQTPGFINSFSSEPVQKTFQCTPSDDKEKDLRRKLIRNMMEEYKHLYTSDEVKLENSITNMILLNTKLQNLKNIERNKYQSYANLLASQVSELDIVKSPFSKKFNTILENSNLFQKNKEVLQFIHKYSRSAIFPEDKYWFYCKETNTKLVPSFYFKLACAIVQNKNSFDNTKYKETIKTLYRDQGVEEDGYIKDKYSGDIIAVADFDSDEGYDEYGHKIQSRADVEYSDENPLENNVEDVTDKLIDDELQDESKNRQSQDKEFGMNLKEFTTNIVDYLSSELNINLGNHKEYVVFKSLVIFEKYRNKNEEYTLVLLTIAMFFVGVQMYFPNLTGKYIRVNDCKASFKGYPLENDTDYSGIEFFSCLVAKRRKRISKKLKQTDEAKIKEKLVTIIKSFILDNIKDDLVDIENALSEKQKLLSIFLNKNLTFLPPMIKFAVPSNNLQNHLSTIKENVKRQADMITNINAVKSKNILFSYALIEAINNNINKEDLNLQNHNTNEYYLENSCCSINKITNIIDYFNDKERDIGRYLNIVMENEKFLQEMSYSPINYISVENYKIKENVESNAYTNKTIELFFDKYTVEDTQEKTYGYMIQNINTKYEESNKIQLYDKANVSFVDYLLLVFTKIESMQQNDIIEKLSSYVLQTKDAKEMKDVILKKLGLSQDLDSKISELETKYLEYTNEKNSISKILLNMKGLNSIQTLRNAIRKYCFIFPSIITTGFSLTGYSNLPKHWQLSKDHYKLLIELIHKYYSLLVKFQSSNDISFIGSFLYKYKQFEPLLQNLNVIPLNDEEFIIDEELIHKIYHYVFLEILVHVCNNISNVTEKNIFKNLMVEYKNDYQTYLKTYDFDMELLQKRVLKAKEREKDRITNRLKKMNDAQRQIERELKKNKLGEWNIGEQKGLREYDKNFRDANRPEGEEVYQRQDEETDFSFNMDNDNE